MRTPCRTWKRPLSSSLTISVPNSSSTMGRSSTRVRRHATATQRRSRAPGPDRDDPDRQTSQRRTVRICCAGTERVLPHNSDIGGHHLAFYVDDIDSAYDYVRSIPGVVVQEGPNGVDPAAPVAGQRWFYFQSPWGMQLELTSCPHRGLLRRTAGGGNGCAKPRHGAERQNQPGLTIWRAQASPPISPSHGDHPRKASS